MELVTVENLVDDLPLSLLLQVELPLHVRNWAAVTSSLYIRDKRFRNT